MDWFLYDRDLRHEGINAFLAIAPILYPLKTPENLWFSDVFRWYKMGTLAKNGLINSCIHFMFQRADQRVSLVCKVLVGLFFMFLAVSSIPAILHEISWLTFLDFFSYVKLVITLIKYIPQVGLTKEIVSF